MNLLAFSHHGGVRLAEVAFLLVLIAGVWLVASEFPQFKLAAARRVVTGGLLAIAGLLLVIASHWGHFG